MPAGIFEYIFLNDVFMSSFMCFPISRLVKIFTKLGISSKIFLYLHCAFCKTNETITVKKLDIILIIMLLLPVSVYSQVTRTEIGVEFRLNRSDIDRSYASNSQKLADIFSFFEKVKQDTSLTVLEVSFCGSASPEGSYQINRQLARKRLESLESLVRSEIDIPENLITRDDSYIPWDYLAEQISASDIQNKDQILEVIADEPSVVEQAGGRLIDSRIIKLQAIDNGKVWQVLQDRYFANMRNAYVVFILYKDEYEAEVEDVVMPDEEIELDNQKIQVDTMAMVQPAPVQEPVAVEIELPEPVSVPNLYVKTNTIGLALGVTNLGAEIDIVKHLSFNIHMYYAAYNYFVQNLKFRTLAAYPELRYWFKEDNQGFFLGAHMGVAQYNYAFTGDYRYQDHDGKTPALGGGLNVGYRMPISENQRWFMEFTLGGGVYPIHYDVYYNVKNGKYVESKEKTYFGFDNASVTILYRFDLKSRR